MARRFVMRRLIAPLIILVLLLAACGGNSNTNSNTGVTISQQGLTSGNSYIQCPSGGNTTAAAAESGTVTLNVSGFESSPAEDALVQQNLNRFTASHPTIKVNWSPIPGDYVTKMRAN